MAFAERRTESAEREKSMKIGLQAPSPTFAQIREAAPVLGFRAGKKMARAKSDHGVLVVGRLLGSNSHCLRMR